jgi:hypothetical protein
MKFAGVVVDVQNGMQASGMSGIRCRFINAAPQLINKVKQAKTSLAQSTKLIKSTIPPKSNFSVHTPRQPHRRSIFSTQSSEGAAGAIHTRAISATSYHLTKSKKSLNKPSRLSLSKINPREF